MKIFVSKDVRENPLMKSAIVFFLVFEMLYVAGAFIEAHFAGGFSTASVRAEYLGDNEFAEPMSLTLLLEEVHTRSFFAAVLLLTACSIFTVTAVTGGLKHVLIYSASAGALAYVLSGPLILYVSPAFSPVMIVSFVIFHAGLFAMAALGLPHFLKRPSA